jgi:putative redox protein
MKITLKRLDQAYHMQASNDNGNTLEMDGSPDIGGGNKAMRPMQTLIAALGGCSSIDVINLLEKMRQPLEDIQITINGERVEGQVPSLFTNINIHYILYGDLDPKKAERAIALSVEKYCSVGKIIEKTANITWTYEIIK